MTTTTSGDATPTVQDEDEVLDDEQLEEYKEMLEGLGAFADRVKINSLSMIAEDYSDSQAGATAIYQAIRDRLLKAPRDKLLPLVYAVDSILKNAKGHYIDVVEQDAQSWIPVVYRQLSEPQRAKLQKMWKTWNDSRIFAPESLKAMGRCFDDKASVASGGATEVAGISRTRDGTLVLPRALREEMENVLADVQKDYAERDKVSLERIADIDPKLLSTIKDTAQANLQLMAGSNNASDSSPKKDESRLPEFFVETRSPSMLEYSASWKAHSMDIFKEAKEATDAVSAQVDRVYQGRYAQNEALEMTQCAATAKAVTTFLTRVVDMIQEEQAAEKANRKVLSGTSSGFRVDPSLFTNDGIKQKNTAVIGILYEVGLPFQSSADGRRFRTQLELSKHLDALFKRAQLEKSITRAEERGWFISDGAWQGEEEEDMAPGTAGTAMSTANDASANKTDDGYNPEASTMPADESRDRCAICGLNFKMFFDNEDGMYKYKNCREIEVLNDDEVALEESEDMLVHVTCWRALGSPEVLTRDQALQDNVNH